jgi:uncharacterized protein involved in tolerance to divalent cations
MSISLFQTEWLLANLKISWVMWNLGTEVFCTMRKFVRCVVVRCLNACMTSSLGSNSFWKWKGKLSLIFVITTECPISLTVLTLFQHMNGLNNNRQRVNYLVSELFDKINFGRKLHLWYMQLRIKVITHFSSMRTEKLTGTKNQARRNSNSLTRIQLRFSRCT